MNQAFYKALKFAIKAHDGQKDKGGLPYILHPIYVSGMLLESDTHAVVVALLHDVLEDTNVTTKELATEFGYEILEDVWALTRGYLDNNGYLKPYNEYPSKDERTLGYYKKETYRDYIVRVQNNAVAKRVKIEDLRHNLSRMENIPPSEREGLQNRYLKALVYLMDPAKYPEY